MAVWREDVLQDTPQRKRLEEIGDSELFTGREVKRLCLELMQGGGAQVRWITLEEAASLLCRKEGTLRNQCRKWSMMQDPPIRVRKKGPATGSHWLLEESAVYSLVRRNNVHAMPASEAGASDATAGDADGEEETERMWCEIVTRNLGTG